MGAPADLAGLVKGLHVEGNDLALYGGNLCLRPNLQTHRGGGDVLNVQQGAHGGLAVAETGGDGLTGSALHQRHHTGGSVNQQISGAHLSGGILPLHAGFRNSLHANGNFHRYHVLSDFNITEMGVEVNEILCLRPKEF